MALIATMQGTMTGSCFRPKRKGLCCGTCCAGLRYGRPSAAALQHCNSTPPHGRCSMKPDLATDGLASQLLRGVAAAGAVASSAQQAALCESKCISDQGVSIKLYAFILQGNGFPSRSC